MAINKYLEFMDEGKSMKVNSKQNSLQTRFLFSPIKASFLIFGRPLNRALDTMYGLSVTQVLWLDGTW